MEQDYSFLLPQDKVTGPDKDGIKKTVECYFNDAGQKVKKTTTTRVTKLGNTRISKTGIERRKSWVKFGDAVHDNAGDNLAVVSREVIAFERPNAPEKLDSQGRRIESQNNQIKTMAKDLSDIRGELNVLTTAFKELYLAGASKDMFFQETSDDVQEEQQQQQQHQHNLNNLWQSLWQSSMQTPPGVQNEQVSQSSQGQATRQQQSVLRQQRQQGQATRQPTQLDSMGQQADLNELFSPFGSVSRVYVVMDHKTGMGRGFGFVNFVRREAGERAIAKLNGYGYDNLILRVEWAAPRAN
ncbi:eukaryotic translation initiation factor 3 subunit G-like protein [Tanacetum coccineum]